MSRHVYFLGIGGIGMSALARWFQANGAEVAGYDRTPTDLTRSLAAEGMAVDHSGDIACMPTTLQEDMAQGHTARWTIVWTPAIPSDFPLLVALRAAGFEPMKRAELLGRISRERPLLAVAGTHGKTTTTSLLAHILDFAGIPMEAFLGGIALGRASNLWMNQAEAPGATGQQPPWMVAEADEFDRSFLQLYPRCAAITSVEPDHLDIYGEPEQLLEAFRAFAAQVDEGGLLVHADAALALTAKPTPGQTEWQRYGELGEGEQLSQKGWVAAYASVEAPEGTPGFTLHLEGCAPMPVRWRMPGSHNAANATAAAYLALQAGVDPSCLAEALGSFPGVARRFEVRHTSDQHVIVDDYAHHPSEISGTIAAARLAYPGRHITGVFQPHLYSRTRDFMTEFARALSALDACILLPIYAARETPMPGVDAQGIGEKMAGCPVKCPPENRFLDVLEELDPDVLLFMGAGDLDQWIDPAWARLEGETNPPRIESP